MQEKKIYLGRRYRSLAICDRREGNMQNKTKQKKIVGAQGEKAQLQISKIRNGKENLRLEKF